MALVNKGFMIAGRKIRNLHYPVTIVCALFFFRLTAQVSMQFGQLDIKNYSPYEYKASPQNWAAVQDNDGLLYFGNNEGILIFDGLRWDLLQASNESAIRSLEVSPGGTVFAGAVGDFGYIRANRHGRLEYVSIQKKFKLSPENIGDVYKVHTFDQGVYFMTNQHVYFYNGHSLKVWESESAFQSAYRVNGAYILNQLSTGLCMMKDDSIAAMSEVNDFKNMKIYDIIHYSKKDMLVLTERHGIYSFFKHSVENTHDVNYRNKINTEVRNYNPFNGLILKDKILSIGTWGHGLLLVDEDGDIIQQVNTTSGLADEVINAQYLDREGNLWLATSNGISMITLNEKLIGFGDKVNVNETVEKIIEFNNTIFIATHTGLFYWAGNGKTGTFNKIDGIKSECWDLLPFESGGRKMLLIAENSGIYQLDEGMKLSKIVACYPWVFHRYLGNSNNVFAGLDNGLMQMTYRKGEWIIQDGIGDISTSINSIAGTGDNSLWLGGLNHGLIRLEIIRDGLSGSFKFRRNDYDENFGLPEGGVYATEFNKQVLFGTSDGIYICEGKDKFVEIKAMKEAISLDHFQVHRLAPGPGGKLWMSAYWEDNFYTGYFEMDKVRFQWKSEDLRPISKEVFHCIYPVSESGVWMGGPQGLYRCNTSDGNHIPEFSVLVRKVEINKDSVDFDGYTEKKGYRESVANKVLPPSYPYEMNSLTFNFSSQYYRYRSMCYYSHKLVGFEKKWSEWSEDSKAVYTNLFEGSYKFIVRSKNVYGQVVESRPFEFRIMSPWYRTWWAYAFYIVISCALVYGFVILYTRKLKQIIQQRTAEVVAQKEKIEKQKDEVENQRKLLESRNADITSSINYARRLQQALLPDEAFIEKFFPEYFILYKPKDIVSGDFYWMEHLNGIPGRDVALFATVDCTGHGVPGAFVSIVANSGLHRAVTEFGLDDPAQILDKLNEIVIDTLSRGDSDVRDGMDISLCRFDFQKMEMQFAGANNSVYLVREGIREAELGLNGRAKIFNGDLIEIRADKQPVGYYEYREEFCNCRIQLRKGDLIYLFSDGYADQFGGPNGKKYNYPRFKEFLCKIHRKEMAEQKKLIESEFERWRGGENQVDDVIVAGIRI